MKKLIGAFLLIGLVFLGACSNSKTAANSPTKKKEVNYSAYTEELNNCAAEYTAVLNSMIAYDLTGTTQHAENLEKAVQKLDKKVANEKKASFKEDIQTLTSSYSGFTENIKNSEFKKSSAAGTSIGKQSRKIANTYYKGKLPKALQDFLDENDKKEKEEEERKNKIYAKGETWEVPGQWKLTINGIRKSAMRNQFSDKNPADVIVINYSYENTGYEKSIQDLYLTVDKVVDESGSMAQTYPSTDTSNALTPTPIGARCDGAEVAYGLNNPSGKVKVTFSKYDSKQNEQTATFEIPVE